MIYERFRAVENTDPEDLILEMEVELLKKIRLFFLLNRNFLVKKRDGKVHHIVPELVKLEYHGFGVCSIGEITVEINDTVEAL